MPAGNSAAGNSASWRRLGWRWLVAVMTPGSEVHFFDPARVRAGAAVTFGEAHALDNVLRWLEVT